MGKMVLSRPSIGTWLRGVQIPNSLAGQPMGPGQVQPSVHPHKIDFYIPRTGASHALVALHGGGGTALDMARQLNLVRAPAGTTPKITNINWKTLEFWHTMVVIPSGQSCTGVDPLWGAGNNPFNPADVDSRNADNPNGIGAWDSHFMRSGYNDMQFLNDLKLYILTHYGAIGYSLMGHSAGGYMVQRVYREQNTMFLRYMAICAPPAGFYIANPLQPLLMRPLYVQFSGKDGTLGIYGGPYPDSPNVSHYTEDTWTNTASNLTREHVSWPALSVSIGGWKDWCDQVQFFNAGVRPVLGDGVVTSVKRGTQTLYKFLTNKLQLRYLSDPGHDLGDIQKAAGKSQITMCMQFVLDT